MITLSKSAIELLSQWLQPHHLMPENLNAYRQTFIDKSGFLLTINDFLKVDYAQRLYSFMSRDAEYKRLYALYSEKPCPKEKWLTAEQEARFFAFSEISGVKEGRSNIDIFTYYKFCEQLKSETFLKLFNYISNLDIEAIDENVYGHAFYENDFLKPHSDRVRNRKLAFIIYINPKWQKSFGGNLSITNHDNLKTEVSYEFNKLVVFDVDQHKEHYISPIINTTENTPRLSIGGWYK